MSPPGWSKREKEIARQAYKRARQREYAALIKEIRNRAQNLREPEDVWELHGFLSEQRRQFNRIYDDRYSQLLLTLAYLIRKGWRVSGILPGSGVWSPKTSAAGSASGAHQTFSDL
jgi:hypothetical protein